MAHSQTPSQLGYRMPAEWEPHVATWLSWPRPEGVSFPDAYEEVMPTFVAMVKTLSTSEIVRINVSNDKVKNLLADLLKGIPNVEYFSIPINEPWCRDHGPIFLKKNASKLILDWGYNAWGGKYPPFDKDDVVPTEVARHFGLDVISPGMVLEGGSIEVNGKGTLLTTESCLLNPNRNPNLSKAEIEQKLKDYLSVTNILWLGDGIEGDDTDGHVDDLTRFVNEDTVVTVLEADSKDSNYEPLLENYKKLQTMKLENGKPLNVLKLPMPSRIDREDLRLPASYANFYIANKVVLMPVFEDANDKVAVETMEKLFPTRKIVPISCRSLIWGLGAFHCLTQQEPA